MGFGLSSIQIAYMIPKHFITNRHTTQRHTHTHNHAHRRTSAHPHACPRAHVQTQTDTLIIESFQRFQRSLSCFQQTLTHIRYTLLNKFYASSSLFPIYASLYIRVHTYTHGRTQCPTNIFAACRCSFFPRNCLHVPAQTN